MAKKSSTANRKLAAESPQAKANLSLLARLIDFSEGRELPKLREE